MRGRKERRRDEIDVEEISRSEKMDETERGESREEMR